MPERDDRCINVVYMVYVKWVGEYLNRGLTS